MRMMTREEIEKHCLSVLNKFDSQESGLEEHVEYHEFLKNGEQPVIMQWRVHILENILKVTRLVLLVNKLKPWQQ